MSLGREERARGLALQAMLEDEDEDEDEVGWEDCGVIGVASMAKTPAEEINRRGGQRTSKRRRSQV